MYNLEKISWEDNRKYEDDNDYEDYECVEKISGRE